MTCSYSKELNTLSFTGVENVFIYEYMPEAAENCVKVYLYGLFLCRNKEFTVTAADFAKTLKMSETEVLDCFRYWEEFGLVSIADENNLDVVYNPVKASYGKPRKIKAEKYAGFVTSVQSLIPERMVSTGEYSEYFNIMETFGIKQDAMLMIIKYCVDRKGANIGAAYINKVAKDFGNRQINTVERVESELANYVFRTAEIEKILRALSSKRQPEIEDLNYLNKWTKELGFETENVVYAASLLKKSSMQKLDSFLMEMFAQKFFSKREMSDFASKRKATYDLAVKINKTLSVYYDVMDAVIDNYTSKWLSFGFCDDALLYIANYCFKKGMNSLEKMDKVIVNLYEKGLISLESVSDYYFELNKNDAFIGEILERLGLNRRPTSWDRSNLELWRKWNFSDEMISEAASLSAGKNNSVAYMNAVLGNWKNKNIFSKNQIESSNFSAPANNAVSTALAERLKTDYALSRQKAEKTASDNLERALSDEKFKIAYYGFNGLEKDIAIAELNGKTEELKKFAAKQKEYDTQMNTALAEMGLTKNDLSPRYRCLKCGDTGNIGSEKCACFYERLSEMT